MAKQQTAIDWLKKELEDYGSPSHLNLDWSTFDELCEQAKQMEKEQLKMADKNGFDRSKYHHDLEYGGSRSEEHTSELQSH